MDDLDEIRKVLKTEDLSNSLRPDHLIEGLLSQVLLAGSAGDVIGKTEKVAGLSKEIFSQLPNTPKTWKAYYAGMLQAIAGFNRLRYGRELALAQFKPIEEAGDRPFHQTILDAIREAQSGHELWFLAKLIRDSAIPKDHDTILAVWVGRLREVGETDDFGVTESLLKKKEAAGAKLKKQTNPHLEVLRVNLEAYREEKRQAEAEPIGPRSIQEALIPVLAFGLLGAKVRGVIAKCRENGVPEEDILDLLGPNADLALISSEE